MVVGFGGVVLELHGQRGRLRFVAFGLVNLAAIVFISETSALISDSHLLSLAASSGGCGTAASFFCVFSSSMAAFEKACPGLLQLVLLDQPFDAGPGVDPPLPCCSCRSVRPRPCTFRVLPCPPAANDAKTSSAATLASSVPQHVSSCCLSSSEPAGRRRCTWSATSIDCSSILPAPSTVTVR